MRNGVSTTHKSPENSRRGVGWSQLHRRIRAWIPPPVDDSGHRAVSTTRAAGPVVIVAVLLALLAGSTQAQEPPDGPPPVTKPDKLEATPLVDAGAVWSATMVVGQPSHSRGHAYVGYSYFKRSGALEPTGFDYRGERIRVLAVAYSATAHKLGVAVNRELASELALQVGDVEFAVADAALMRSRYVSHVVYEWDTTELDWAVGDSVDVAVAAPPTPVFDASVLPARPNVVLILADDLGWGDVASNNPDSAMTTPNIDSIATAGVNFTDAHSPSSVCSPTRYGLLTGRYPWRTWLKRGVVWGYDRPMIETGQPTLGTLLQQHGYRTAAVGKWHLGMEFPLLSDPSEVTARNRGFDFNAPILDGPLDHGFDEFFGLPANPGWRPRAYVRGDRFVADPDDAPPSSDGRVVYDEVLDRLTGEAVTFIERAGRGDSPFFLYLPVPVPHVPVAPNPAFKGSTGLGHYADYIAQLDWSVGQVLDALDQAGAENDTLVIFTSDNGSYKRDGIRVPNHATHHSNGPWRDGKGSVYEGGHRVPLMMHWPAAIAPGSQIDATVSLTDLYSTLAEITGQAPEPGTAPDSVSLLPLMLGETDTRGEPVVHHSQDGMFSLRDGPWKLIFGQGDGVIVSPHRPFSRPWQLYNLDRDPGEQSNRILDQPARIVSLRSSLERIRGLENQTLSSDSTLQRLEITGADIGAFDPGALHYEATVDDKIGRLPIAAVPSAADASIRVWDSQSYNYTGHSLVLLPETVNPIEIRVTSPDTTSTTTYTVTITKEKRPLADPVVAGTAQQGQTLVADVSELIDEFLIEGAYSYQWTRRESGTNSDIDGATAKTYVPVEDDVGAQLTVRVTYAYDEHNSESQTSAPTQQVTPPPDQPTTGRPKITGTAQAGEVLTADLSGVSDADGIKPVRTRYQWVADAEEIAGATGRHYTVQPGDVDKSIQVRVSITDRNDNIAILFSPAVVAQPAQSLAPLEPPYRPEGLRAEAVDAAVRLRWVAPDGIGWVTNHLVWRHRPESGDPEPSEPSVETGSVARSFTDAEVEPGVLYEYRVQAVDLFGYTGELSEAVSVRVPAVAPSLTAEVSGVPSSHDGQSPLRFDLVFSEEPDLSYVTLRDHAFSVAGGEVVGARRLDPPSNLRWEITVVPAGSADVVVVLAPTADCADTAAICTSDGERLSSRIEIEISGP